MLLASLFGLGLLWLYVRARGSIVQRAGATGMFALALCAAESGLSTLAYLAAYALTFETGSLPRRIARLVPELAVLSLWAALYVSGGYGARGLSLYRELSAPGSVLAGGLRDLPAWLFILLGPSLLDMAMLQAPVIARSVAAVLCLPLLLALYYALPRTRAAAFFGLGALFCLPPLFTTLPQDRLLTMASFGGFGMVASLVAAIAQRAAPPRWLRSTRTVLIAMHLVLAPLLFIPALGQNRVIDQAALTVASAVPQAAPRHVVLVNAPVELLTLCAWQRLANEPADQRPETLAQLYAGGSQLRVRRVDERTLKLRPEHGWAVSRSNASSPTSCQVLARSCSSPACRSTWRKPPAMGAPRACSSTSPPRSKTPACCSWRGTKLAPCRGSHRAWGKNKHSNRSAFRT